MLSYDVVIVFVMVRIESKPHAQLFSNAYIPKLQPASCLLSVNTFTIMPGLDKFILSLPKGHLAVALLLSLSFTPVLVFHPLP
jgi:hypothetical protein